MRAEVYPIPDVPRGRLAIMPRPRAGDWLEGEIASWKSAGLDVIVSLLEEAEVRELGLLDEAAECESAGLIFLNLPAPDRGIPPSRQEVSRLVTRLVNHLNEGRGVGIHCRIGVGRSALIAACVLVALGVPLERAWLLIETARGLPVPDTSAQKDWVTTWASALV